MIDGKEYIIGFETTRFGPAITRVEKGKPKAKKEYGNVPKGVDVSKMTLEDAIQCLPLSLGTWKRKKVIAKKGKYGPYLQVGKDTYVSVPMDVWESGLDTKKAKSIL
jgi:topoisomerase IA-like protein